MFTFWPINTIRSVHIIMSLHSNYNYLACGWSEMAMTLLGQVFLGFDERKKEKSKGNKMCVKGRVRKKKAFFFFAFNFPHSIPWSLLKIMKKNIYFLLMNFICIKNIPFIIHISFLRPFLHLLLIVYLSSFLYF